MACLDLEVEQSCMHICDVVALIESTSGHSKAAAGEESFPKGRLIFFESTFLVEWYL